MLYRLEALAITKTQEAKLEVAELKIHVLRFYVRVTKMDRKRNDTLEQWQS